MKPNGEEVSPKHNVENDEKKMEQEFEETMKSVGEEVSPPKHNVENEEKKVEQEFEETMKSVGEEVSPKHNVENEEKKMEQEFEETMKSVGEEVSPKHNVKNNEKKMEKEFVETMKSVGEEVSPKHNVENEEKEMEQEFEETMKSVGEEISPKHNVKNNEKKMEKEFEETMKSVGEEVSPNHNVKNNEKKMEQEFEETMRFVSEKNSPKHNVETENKKLEQEFEEAMKSCCEEKVSPKHNVENEEREMEQEFEETMKSVGEEVSPERNGESENKKMEQDFEEKMKFMDDKHNFQTENTEMVHEFEETMKTVNEEVSLERNVKIEKTKMEQDVGHTVRLVGKVSPKHNDDDENKTMEQEFEDTMKFVGEDVSPKDKMETKNKKMEQDFEETVKFDGGKISPKHNVEIENKKKKMEQDFEDTMKFVGENLSPKQNVEVEEEMEEIDIHEVNKTEKTQQAKLISDGDDDTESSSDSNDEETIEEKGEDPKPPVGKISSHDLQDPNSTTSAWTEKAAAIRNFVRVRSEVAVHTFMRRLSGKLIVDSAAHDISNARKETKDDVSKDTKPVESPKAEAKSIWNPLSYLKMMQNDDSFDKGEAGTMEAELEPVMMKGRIILYTRLGCEECRECRLYLHEKRLSYVEINVDIYPTRKLELEKFVGPSSDVPKVFFNEELVRSLKELKEMEESGELEEKIKHLIAEAPPREAPPPPFSGEDDASSKGPIDELALIVRKMKPCIIKDRFYKMRRFKNCFLGSEAVDFLSTDQRLERDEAVEVARKLASQLFFQHVLDENLFEDGNHLYRFLDDDPVVSSQCHNIPRGIIELKPRPIAELAYRLRLLYRSILEAYTSPNGKHVDYRSIHGSEEFARYLRIIQELHRIELEDMQREEKLAFFINLYNMMAIHAILVWGHPTGPLERTKMFGDFKYVIGGYTYSLSAIQNGILRGNQRPPYNLMKPFGAKDKRSKVALPYVEPLSHFGLVCGTRSGPPLRCFSPKEIDKELMEAARDFLRGGGLIVDLSSKVAYINKIFNWYGVDFGKGEEEVLKHASTYLEPQLSEALLDLLVDTQFKVVYQTYDWGLNN